MLKDSGRLRHFRVKCSQPCVNIRFISTVEYTKHIPLRKIEECEEENFLSKVFCISPAMFHAKEIHLLKQNECLGYDKTCSIKINRLNCRRRKAGNRNELALCYVLLSTF